MSPTHTGAPLSAPARVELRARRRRITRTLLLTLVVLGSIAYLPSMWAAVTLGVWWIAILDTVVYAAVIVATFWPGLDDRVRGGVVVGVSAVLGVSLSAGLGSNGAGPIWLLAVPVLTAILFDRRATVWSLVFVTAALAGVAALRATGVVAWEVAPAVTLLWIILASNALLLAAVLGIAVASLIAGLTEAAERTERYGAALAQEQELLLESNDQLERARVERARAESRLRQAEKMTAIGTLAGGIAHDMNNLLVPILASAEMLRADEADGTMRADLLDRNLAAGRAARDLVDRILAFARPTAEARTALDAGTVFREATWLLQATLPPAVDVVFRAEPDAGAVLLSPGAAHQLVLNLGRNGAEAMGGRGQLVLSLDAVRATGEEGGGAVAMPASGWFVRLMVSDAGVGMDDETRSRLFEPFFTRRGRHEGDGPGHGLGLATAHGLVADAGGAILVHSRPGAGTTMEVLLPRVASPTPAPQPHEVPRFGLDEVVLVVDDDPDVLLLAVRLLERAGYAPEAADSADAALRRLAGDHGVDLVITDLDMPGMDGIDLARRVRALDPGLPVVLASGLLTDEDRGRAADAGVHTIVPKPFGLRDLPRAAAAALAGGPVSPASG